MATRTVFEPQGNRVKKPKLATWAVTRLKPHPTQAKLFMSLRGAGLADIKARGFDRPIEVLPDGIVVDDHQSYYATPEAGLAEVPVLIRYDLAGDPAAAERRMLDANGNGKQPDALGRARVELRRMELEEGVAPGGLGGYGRSRLRDRLADRLGLSPEHTRRLIDVVTGTPMPVQAAVSDGRLGITAAARLAKAGPKAVARVAAAVDAGGDPAEAAAGVAAARRKSARALNLPAFVAALERVAARAEGRKADPLYSGPDARALAARFRRVARSVLLVAEALVQPGVNALGVTP